MKINRLLAALLLLSLLFCLCACGAKYRDDVPLSRFSAGRYTLSFIVLSFFCVSFVIRLMSVLVGGFI